MSKPSIQPPDCLLYVCCGSKCKKRGAKQFYKQLRTSVKENSLKRSVKVIKTGCTDNCKKGPVVAVMPENKWLFEVNENAVRSLADAMVQRFLKP